MEVSHSSGMRSTGRASSIGSSVPRPDSTAVGTATRRPRRSSSIPPLLPGLNSASVRIQATSSRLFIWKPLISPLVTLMVRTPSGKPKANSRLPGRSWRVSASGMLGKRR